MTNGTTTDVVQQIENDLTVAQGVLPLVMPLLSLIPGVGQVAWIFQTIPVVIQAVQTIMKLAGVSKTTAITQVLMHLTPGMPNSVHLGPATFPGGQTPPSEDPSARGSA